jgi:hypothetical protein
MITAKFSVQPVGRGWAVRIGPDVLVLSPTKSKALLEADLRAAIIRRHGGRAIVVEEHAAAFESAIFASAGGNLGLQVTLSTTPGAVRPASKGNG